MLWRGGWRVRTCCRSSPFLGAETVVQCVLQNDLELSALFSCFALQELFSRITGADQNKAFTNYVLCCVPGRSLHLACATQTKRANLCGQREGRRALSWRKGRAAHAWIPLCTFKRCQQVCSERQFSEWSRAPGEVALFLRV